jgi:hypothetical protein
MRSRHAVRAHGIQGTQLLGFGSAASGLDEPGLQGSALLHAPESSPAKFQARSAREAMAIPSVKAAMRFVRKGFKPPSCWIPVARRAAARFAGVCPIAHS